MEPLLVAFATKTGSSEEVACFVAEALRNHGLNVDLLSVRDVHSLDQYGAIVLVAALYIGRLHKDVRRFLAALRASLINRPVALLVLGPVENREKDFVAARQQLDKELGRFPWLSPVASHIVGGRFDPAKLSFPFNLTLKKIPASDARDWTAIRALVDELATVLQPAIHA